MRFAEVSSRFPRGPRLQEGGKHRYHILAVIHKVRFSDSRQSCTCQCTQCRKQSGALFWPCHQVKPASAFKWTSEATLKIFKASPEGERAFCSSCGSWVTWKPTNPAEKGDGAEFAVGTVDQIYLIGEGVETVHTAADGEEQTIPENGFGFALANLSGTHFWTENEIKGVTDNFLVKGRKPRSVEIS